MTKKTDIQLAPQALSASQKTVFPIDRDQTGENRFCIK
jgi:hypothetical protein